MKKIILIALAIISIIILLLEFDGISFKIIAYKLISIIYLSLFSKANNYFYRGE